MSEDCETKMYKSTRKREASGNSFLVFNICFPNARGMSRCLSRGAKQKTRQGKQSSKCLPSNVPLFGQSDILNASDLMTKKFLFHLSWD